MIYSTINPLWQCDPVNNQDPYHEQIKGSDLLIITVGDSWTWGDSLGSINKDVGIFDDYDYRTSNIYGYHLSNRLNADWVNLAICGTDNLSMLQLAHQFIQGITKEYKKIHIVITLSESGREFTNFFSGNLKNKYNNLKGANWPSFDEVLNGADLSTVINECNDQQWLFPGLNLEFYQAVTYFVSLDDLLLKAEAAIFETINNLFDSYTVGRNFTRTYDENKSILNDHLVDKTWNDIICDQGNLTNYPNVRVMSQMGIDPLIKFINNRLPKEQLLTLFSLAEEGIDWLNNSPYNSKKATKHPLEQAHVWWADYLYNHVNNKLCDI